jgi:hypothetical protein
MDTETLKLNLVQQILNLSDARLLEKVKELLSSESIIGYEANGKPVSTNQYLKDMEEVDEQIKAGTLKTYSTDEVRQRILGNR